MKITVFFVLGLVCLSAAAVVQKNPKNHSEFWGNVLWGSQLVYNVNVVKKHSFLSYVTEYVQFPPPGIVNNRQIVAIRALDQKNDDTGAYATILSGGINATSVRIQLKSKFHHGIHYGVEVYTR